MGADRELTADPQVHHQVLLGGLLEVENIAVLRELAPPPGPGGGSASCYLFSFSSRRKLCSCCILVDNLGGTEEVEGTENSVTRSSQRSECCSEDLLSLFTVYQSNHIISDGVATGVAVTSAGAATVPAEAVEQGHDLLSRQLEPLGGSVFREFLDLLLREEDLQGGTQTLSLHTTHTE